jgi:hypothetical protein
MPYTLADHMEAGISQFERLGSNSTKCGTRFPALFG